MTNKKKDKQLRLQNLKLLAHHMEKAMEAFDRYVEFGGGSIDTTRSYGYGETRSYCGYVWEHVYFGEMLVDMNESTQEQFKKENDKL